MSGNSAGNRIAVLGAGSWGTSLAISFARQSQNRVSLWCHRVEHAEEVSRHRENRRYLPGHALPDSLAVTADADTALTQAEWIVCAIPSQYLRESFSALAPKMTVRQAVISATKGLETGTHLRMTSLLAECFVDERSRPAIGALSGPSFAAEVAQGQPTAVTVAFPELADAVRAQQALTSETLRIYSSDDVTGVELGGALKNVMAIAAGLVTGLGLGYNSTAALIVRGSAEMTRLAVAAGARRETLAGLSGTGDLILTCTGALSRNRAVGVALAEGRPLAEILAAMEGRVAEGVRTAEAALELAASLGIEMPITRQMQAILRGERDPRTAMRELMQRPARTEADSLD